jgi:septal ring factor EnvC (AmiA/AmiB activator)
MDGRSSDGFRPRALGVGRAAAVLALSVTVSAQPATDERQKTEAMANRVKARVEALQREAERLARQSRSVLVDMRRLEVERDLATEQLAVADRAVKGAETELLAVSRRLAEAEQQRVSNLPDLRGRFVELYKHGRGSYARMLMGVRDVREFGRATRAVASLSHINEQRIERHRRTLEEIRVQRRRAEAQTRELESKRADARRARAAAARAVHARAAMLDEIDRRRDLNAQLAGELQVAQQRLESAVQNIGSGQPVEAVSVPLSPFRGALDWPVSGQLVGRFGQSNRMSSEGVRNGIEVAAPVGAPVRAVHPGTVGFADAFTGYGTLVILDHGANHYTLYGYLSEASVQQGQRVSTGDELGRVGSAPLGDAALYYEMRVDGRSVDPLQWLKKR